MGRTITALAVVVLLTACGGTNAEGMAAELDRAGIGLAPGVTAERYYDHVRGMCDLDGDYDSATLRAFGQPQNAEALQRMAAGMNYVCGDGDRLLLQVQALTR